MTGTASPSDVTRQSFLKESEFFRISSPLFSALTRACADDTDILQMSSATRRGQSAGNLLMCVAQYLLMQEPREPLAKYYRSMTDTPLPQSDAFPSFREFCLERRAAIMELLSWRTVNTNLPDKATCLLPAIQHIAQWVREPITLLEICCSSGLNMLFDEYHYDYGPFGRVGPEMSPVRLECKVVGGGRPPVGNMPQVARRVGVDLVTVDVADPLERLWMEAVLGPEWVAERKQLRAALSLRSKHELQMIRGDALEALPSLLEGLPGSLCILQSYCIGHWSRDARAALEDLLLTQSRHRDIQRLSIEGPDGEPPESARLRMIHLAEAGIPILQKSSPSRIEHIVYSKGKAQGYLLGEGSIFGTWLDWRANAV